MKNHNSDAFNKIDRLADRSRKHLFSLSPNDVLVQISLPLVLILAIATRLMILSQSIATQNKGPSVLDMWKQQLILRIDQVLDNWEQTSQYRAFPDFERIQWQGNWPNDKRFKILCKEATALNNINSFSYQLYSKALTYHPPSENISGISSNYLVNIYDPALSNNLQNAENIPEEFKITPERREYALRYINKRCLSWKQHIKNLQWQLVATCAANSPITADWSDRQPAVQMQKLSKELQKKGYPLLSDLTQEYRIEKENKNEN